VIGEDQKEWFKGLEHGDEERKEDDHSGSFDDDD